jgi:hypothetical protein
MAITRKAVFGTAVLLCLATPAVAKEWADALFRNKLSHDFGTVARGATVEYRFRIENIYVEDVHIDWVRTSCRCINPRITKDTLKTYETAELVAELDTRQFIGFREATVTVKLDRPFSAEVQFHVKAFIRGDVVFEPGSVQFGTVAQGQAAVKKVSITYAGRADWRIGGVQPGAAFLDSNLIETGRNPDPVTRTMLVTYDLEVKLKGNAPPGYFKERIVVHTNDPNKTTADVPLTVEGFVVAPLTVNPAVLMFNAVPVGQTVSKNIVLKGAKPFKLKLAECVAPDSRFRFLTADVARPVQVVVVRFSAGDKPGRFSGKLLLKTDLNDSVVELAVDGLVVPDDAAAGTPSPQRNAPEDGGASGDAASASAKRTSESPGATKQ